MQPEQVTQVANFLHFVRFRPELAQVIEYFERQLILAQTAAAWESRANHLLYRYVFDPEGRSEKQFIEFTDDELKALRRDPSQFGRLIHTKYMRWEELAPGDRELEAKSWQEHQAGRVTLQEYHALSDKINSRRLVTFKKDPRRKPKAARAAAKRAVGYLLHLKNIDAHRLKSEEETWQILTVLGKSYGSQALAISVEIQIAKLTRGVDDAELKQRFNAADRAKIRELRQKYPPGQDSLPEDVDTNGWSLAQKGLKLHGLTSNPERWNDAFSIDQFLNQEFAGGKEVLDTNRQPDVESIGSGAWRKKIDPLLCDSERTYWQNLGVRPVYPAMSSRVKRKAIEDQRALRSIENLTIDPEIREREGFVERTKQLPKKQLRAAAMEDWLRARGRDSQ